MNLAPEKDVSKAIRKLYSENAHAQALFDLNARRERDAAATSLNVISRKLDISRGEAVSLARALEETRCCTFKVGRRGSKSRLEWSYSCIGLGRTAAGEAVPLERAEDLGWGADEYEEADEDEEKTAEVTTSFTAAIAEAKAALAKRLGVPPSVIDIVIKA